jgi:membrane-associated protein
MKQLAFELLFHLDKHLAQLTESYGTWTYAILFMVVFCETGLVVTPFLPGDSLLFAAGAICSLGSLNIGVLWLLLVVAAVGGDTVNYQIGHYLGPKVLRGERSWLFNKKHLDRTHAFFEKYGGKTIIIARFVPIIRTFAPFVAGVGAMTYRRFLVYNVVGGVAWVTGFLFVGYWFGNIPWVKQNFSAVILAIIFLSVLPMFIEYFRQVQAAKRQKSSASQDGTPAVSELVTAGVPRPRREHRQTAEVEGMTTAGLGSGEPAAAADQAQPG